MLASGPRTPLAVGKSKTCSALHMKNISDIEFKRKTSIVSYQTLVCHLPPQPFHLNVPTVAKLFFLITCQVSFFLYFVQSEKKGPWFNDSFVFILSMLLSFWELCTWHCSDVTFFQIIASYLNHGLIFWRISVFHSIQVDPWYLQTMTMITRGFCHREMLCSYTNNYVSKCSYIFIPM